MSRRKKKKNKDRKPRFSLPEETKQWIWGVLLILASVLMALSFFDKAGAAGQVFMKVARFSIGEAVFILPLIFLLGALIFLTTRDQFKKGKIFWPIILAIMIFIVGISGVLTVLSSHAKQGGWLGYIVSWPFLQYFGFWASLFIFLAPIAIGGLIFWQYLKSNKEKEIEEKKVELPEKEEKTSIIKKIFAPRFKVEKISTPNQELKPQEQIEDLKLESKPIPSGLQIFSYVPPPLNLLEKERDVPTSGDTNVNSAIIKKTLENFNIDVVMSEINIGPTVTQYTFKPAEGIKLSKITGLSNDLSLALASHPIRIEAPIPGRALVGVEIPNKVRAKVRLKDLIENPSFQKSTANLSIPLGKDVSGFPIYTDLTKMPHMLVAGSTGTGKTIFLNALITSLLYQPSTATKSAGPQSLRLILVDPKRVEFPVFSTLPHLLCPVIYNANQAVNMIKWLTGEMERRFDVLAQGKARDIGGFNESALKNGTEPLPFIVVVIDELADLMSVRGREIEAGIVRIAQMARAVGIHLVVATQRPSVEVITGLIKANITARVTFQVASQVDSRTVIDSSGAEKLLGAGDLLYISAQVPKPKRIQGAYVSEKEVRRVVAHVEKSVDVLGEKWDPELTKEVERTSSEETENSSAESSQYSGDDDPLYEDAKSVVIESGKASSSLLQRRLRLGYARAARLIDMLEDRGVVGPGEGAKPREVYGDLSDQEIPVPASQDTENKDDWNQI